MQAALDLASDGDTVLVLPQNQPYKGTGNTNLDYRGKSVVVRSLEGPGATIMDLENTGRAIDFESIRGASAVLEGFTITGGEADLGGALLAEQSGVQIRNCVFDASNATVEGGGFFSDLSNPTIDGLTLSSNTAPLGDGGVIANTSVNLEGPLVLDAGALEVRSSWFDGPGHIELAPDTLMHITGEIGNAPTVLRSDLVGTGDVLIDLGQELRVESGAVVDLRGGTAGGSCADPAQADFHLLEDSPAVDHGVADDSVQESVYNAFLVQYGIDIQVDIEGMPIPVDGNGDGVVDMGAHERRQP